MNPAVPEPGVLEIRAGRRDARRHQRLPEFAMARGHVHIKAECAELYQCLSGRGVMLLKTLGGRGRAGPLGGRGRAGPLGGRGRAGPLGAGEAVHVPGHRAHRSVDVGEEPFVTLFSRAVERGRNHGYRTEAS